MQLELPDGFFSPADIESYRKLYEQVPEDGITCEIGSYHGRSLCAVADIIRKRNIMVHVVDTWGNVLTGHGAPEHREQYLKATRRFKLRSYITDHIGYSVHKAKELPSGMSLVFLDGDHHYHAVVTDIDLYKPLLRPGGIMAGHDGDYPDVEQAVVEGCGFIKKLPDALWMAEV